MPEIQAWLWGLLLLAIAVYALSFPGTGWHEEYIPLPEPGSSGHFCFHFYALPGSRVAVLVNNQAGAPIRASISAGGRPVSMVIAPGGSATVVSGEIHGIGHTVVSVNMIALGFLNESVGFVHIVIAIEGIRAWSTAIYSLLIVIIIVPAMAGMRSLLSRHGLWLRLEPAIAMGLAAGLLLPAAQARHIGYEVVAYGCSFVSEGCIVDLSTPAFAVSSFIGFKLALLGVLAGSAAAPYQPGMSVESFDSFMGNYSRRRILAGLLAVSGTIFIAQMASLVALAAGTGRLWLMPGLSGRGDIVDIAPLIGTALVLSHLPVLASGLLSAVTRRSQTIAAVLVLALLVVPGETFSAHYAGCADTLSVIIGMRTYLLVATLLAGVVLMIYWWRMMR